MAHTFNPNTSEAQDVRSLSKFKAAWSTEWVSGQAVLQRETQFQKNQTKQTNKKKNSGD